MPAFHYRMQNILDIKSKLEVQQKMEYARANAALQEEQAILEDLLLRRSSYENKLKEEQSGTLHLTEINFLRNAILIMDGKVNEQIRNVSMAQNRVEIERSKLDEAMKERKTYEKLREKAFEEFKAEVLYKESKEVDELVAYTYGNIDDASQE
ncbi:MAG: flagellar export protein FliJ [Lachnospiraceae bacterium]|nr:flagellar export protein FliJ [Lachnospiraceae bacterium]